ncbi:unnamed protein product [Angiostrongylus costaricensis]|uniref:FA_desaturase domain-containing protein n=1 Tax=Angiostrongylus costaricensis TaxID=334426 RepID=A0A0R3PCX2_ANGCS|nr:unnamed protein product [Angiostrongylus costaricensis]
MGPCAKENRFFGMLANLPIAVPFSVSFKKYHVEHHRYLGEDGLDTGVPTELEAQLFTTPARKFFWLLFQPFFYAFRPLIIYRKAPNHLEITNVIVQIAFDAFVLRMFGNQSFLYLILGTLVAMGVHPSAGHFISEHYVFKGTQETYSYYGLWNLCTFNVEYQVWKIASEFYASLYTHSSWTKVLWNFVFSPDMGPYMRLKRGASVGQTFCPRHALNEYYEAVSKISDFFKFIFYSDNLVDPLKRIFQLLQCSGFNEMRHYAAQWLDVINNRKKID